MRGPCCAWCGVPLRYDRHSCCSAWCRSRWIAHGRGPNAATIEMRRVHVEQQPRGCATVEEFLAAGGTIYRGEPRASAPAAQRQPGATR